MDVFINEPEKPKFPLFKNVPLSDRYTGTLGFYSAKTAAAFDNIMTYPFNDP